MKKKIFIWCSDLKKNTGEGILANKFISDLRKYNKNYILEIKTISFKNINLLRTIFGSVADRLLFPFLGILYLWLIFIFRDKQKICFVNYLPLWNFLLFILLPPKTILGPITGGSKYLKKPFSMEELIARIKALLDRNKIIKDTSKSSIGNYIFNYTKQVLHFADKEVYLTSKESELLFHLSEKRNDVLDRSFILKKLWGNDDFFNARSMDVFITKLRKKLSKDEKIKIINVRGIGYKLTI